MKCLNYLGMVYPPYLRLEYPYAVLNICAMRWIVSTMLIIERSGIPRRCKSRLASDWKWYHTRFFSHCMIERKFVGDIVDDQIPVSGWFRLLRRWVVVWCIDLDQFVYALWMLPLILFRYVCKYGLLQSQVVQWCSGISYFKSRFFLVTWYRCLCDVF